MGKLKQLLSEHQRRIAIAMLILTGLMLVDGVYQTVMHVWWRSWLPETLAAEVPTTQPASTQPAQTQPAVEGKKKDKNKDKEKEKEKKPEPHQVHASIAKRNVFAKPAKKGHGMKLTGVIDDVALFVNRSKKTVGIEVGKSSGGVKVVSIDGYEVVIEYQGKKETLKLFSGANDGGGGSSGGPTAMPAPAVENAPSGPTIRMRRGMDPAQMEEIKRRIREQHGGGDIESQFAE